MEKSILDRKVKVGGPYLSVISALKWVEANKSHQVLGQSGYTEKEKQKTTTTKTKKPVNLLVTDHLSTRTR